MYEFDLIVTDEMLNSQRKCRVYVKNYTIRTKNNGNGEYVMGTFMRQNRTLEFRVWSPQIVEVFKEYDLKKTVLLCDLSFSEYQGMKQASIQSLTTENVDKDTSEFIPGVDSNALFEELSREISKLDPKWIQVINLTFRAVSNMDMFERFKHEWAGVSQHDALDGGLLSHTVKMLRLYNTLEANDTRIAKYGNLIRTGIILHDVGKIEEMHDGEPVKDGYIIPHPAKAVVYLERQREAILKLITQEELTRLESVLLGHHNSYGGSCICNTIYACIVHQIDMLDYVATHIAECLDNPMSMKTTASGNEYIAMSVGGVDVKAYV